MRPPPPVDAKDEAILPYPIETIRRWYVSPFGGRSTDLEPDQVGVNGDALRRNTELAGDEAVCVGLPGSDPDRPWFFQEQFRVVPLDERTPEAKGLSPLGEIVLPDRPWDFVRRPDLQPRLGDAVILKDAAKPLGENPDWLRDLLAKSVRRPAL